MIQEQMITLVSSWFSDPKGWCYSASEALYYLAGGKAAGLTPMQAAIEVDGQRVSHWWLEDADGSIIDLTAAQFDFPFPYQLGRGRGFQAKMKGDTKEIIEWIESVGK
jgi:hypothetical protein